MKMMDMAEKLGMGSNPDEMAKDKMSEIMGKRGSEKKGGDVEVNLADKLSNAISNLEPVKVSQETADKIESMVSDNMDLGKICEVLEMANEGGAKPVVAVKIATGMVPAENEAESEE